MIAQLPKDKTASQLLEERTVSVLRRRGLLQSRQARRLRRAWLVGVGQWLSSRTTASVMLAMTRNDQFRAAAHVQRTGTQFVNALQALAHSADSTNTLPAQGREVSLAALYAAASEVVRFAPNDPIAAEIMRGFQRVSQQQMAQPERGSARQILWF
jgi:hypothetical protein